MEWGRVLAVEPKIPAGDGGVIGGPGTWPVVTADRRRAAHFEHTVAITPRGPEILTLPG